MPRINFSYNSNIIFQFVSLFCKLKMPLRESRLNWDVQRFQPNLKNYSISETIYMGDADKGREKLNHVIAKRFNLHDSSSPEIKKIIKTLEVCFKSANYIGI